MNSCCVCGKILAETDKPLEHGWMGLYNITLLIKAICIDCEEKPENKKWYMEEEAFE